MKKASKKLRLGKETIRSLATDELGQAAGGTGGDTKLALGCGGSLTCFSCRTCFRCFGGGMPNEPIGGTF